MFFGLLVATLALQSPAPSERTLAEVRALAVKGLDEFDRTVTEFSSFIENRFPEDSNEPRTGFAVRSAETVGDDGLHAVTVVTVLADSPADRAGIRPGDRIIRVSSRRIEHEPAEVVRRMTDGKAGPLEIAVRRGGKDIVVRVDRAPIACIIRASARIDQAKWRMRVAEMRTLSSMVRASLDERTVPEVGRYKTAMARVVELYAVFQEASELLAIDLGDALDKECVFKVTE